jgi:hypothetical protein
LLVAGPGAVPPVPWDAQKLKPLVVKLHKVAEKTLSGKLVAKAKRAKLPGVIIEQIETKSAWEAGAVEIINDAAPRVAAKYLNKTGISAEYQDEMALAGGYATIAGGYLVLAKDLDKLVKQAEAEEKKAAEAEGKI